MAKEAKETGPKEQQQSAELAYEKVGKVELPPTLKTGFDELNNIREELRKDGIEVSELFKYRVTVLRMCSEAKVTELNAQNELFKRNPSEAVGKRVVTLHDQLRNISERIAQELVTHQRLLLYIQYQNEYFSLKKKMQSGKMDVSLNDVAALSLREKAMQSRIDDILVAMKKRSAILTIKDLQDVINRASGNTGIYESVLSDSIKKYNGLVKKDFRLSNEPSNEDLNDRRNIHIDEFEGALNTSPLIGRIHILYRQFARSKSGSAERSKILEEMNKILESKVAEKGETDAENQARDGLKKFLAGDQKNAMQVDAELPVVELESVMITGALIVSYIDQIIAQHKSHPLNDAENLEDIKKKREYITPLVKKILDDLLNTQYILARESAGFEGVRTGYEGETPDGKEGRVGDFGDNEGAGEKGRKYALARIQTAIEHLKSPVRSSIGETIKEKVAKKIVDIARDIMRKFESLDKILKTDTKKIEATSDILEEGKKERENALEDFQIGKYFIDNVHRIPPPANLSAARQSLTEEALSSARAPYANGTSRLTLKDVQEIISKGNKDPAAIVMLYHCFDAQTNFDLERYSAVQDDKIKRLERTGTEGQKAAKELRDVTEQVKKNMRQMLLDLWNMLPWWMKAIIIAVPSVILLKYFKPLIKGGGNAILNLLKNPIKTGAASVFAYRAYLDYQKIGEISENIKMQKDQIIAELKGAGFIADPPGQDSTFRYKSGGTEIKVNVSELGDALGGQETAQSVRAGGSLAQAALILRYGAGRAFLPVFVAEVIVETLKYRIDQKSDREFLLRAPAWLIAKINLENAIGETGYSMLAKASGEMMSDNLLGDDAEGSKENKEKRDIREKMLFQILMGELREFPELRQDVLGGNSTHPIRLDLFYRKDFKDTFLPVFYARLFESVAKGKLSWKEVTKGQIDSDWNIPIPRLDSVSSSLSPKITLVQLRNAMRESIVFYVQHAREKDYLSALQERSAIEVQIKKNGNPELEAKKKYLDSIITELGKREVFGKKLSSVPKWGDRVKTGTTRASSVAKLLFAGAPKYDHRVKADTVPGLPDGFSFGSNGTIYSHLLLQEPALRTQLNQVIPKTNNEPEGLMYPPIFSIDRFSLPTGHDSVNANFVAAHSVANGVSDAVGLPRMRDKMFGTSDTREAALKRITDGSVLLFASERNKRSQFMRNETLESSLGYYGSKLNKPIVIKKGYRTNKSDMKNFDKLTKMLSDPNNYADSDFDVSKMVAVCFEGKTLPNGHQIVMATYIFGDISSRSDDRPRFYVMQRAAGTSATSNSTTRTSGLNHASGGARFLKQKGASDMLDAVAKELIEKEKQRDAARIKQEAIRRAQMTEWERGKPIRDQKQALQDKIVSAAEERARKIGSNFGYVPGRYIRDEKKEQFRISGNNYQTRYGKWIIKLVPDNIEGVAQMKAAPDKNEKRGFKFSAWNMDTKKSFNFIVDISDLNPDSPKGSMTKEDVYIAREAITTPLNIAGEPREKNKHFVEKVSEYELRRVLSIAKYKGSYRWNADEFRGNLESELLPYYRDAKNKQKFLDTLVDNLIKHSPVSGGITSSTYDTILENMKKKF